MNDKSEIIKEYQRRIGSIEAAAGAQKQPPAVWQRLNELVGKMSSDQLAYVQANPKALRKKQELNALFIEWLFERHKDDFVAGDQFEKEAQAYVDSIAAAASEFSEHNKNLAEENEALKAEIERLKRVSL